MKAVGLALFAATAIGCSATPTSPTTSPDSIAVLTAQDARSSHGPGTMKVTLYFYSPPGGQSLEGMPVTLSGVPDGPSVPLAAGKRGSVTIDVPRNTEEIAWQVFPNAGGFCPASGELVLPYGVRDNWFPIDIRPDCVFAP